MKVVDLHANDVIIYLYICTFSVLLRKTYFRMFYMNIYLSLGGLAAYNAGVGNIQTWEGLDSGTTGNDYSNDVIARAQWLVKNYSWPCCSSSK